MGVKIFSPYEYIISKQIQWSKNQGLTLIGSKGKRGRPLYTPELNMNLFAPLLKSVQENFDQANGNEIIGNPENPAKMQALHSSSALALNVFQYWKSINQVPIITSVCGFCNNEEIISEKIIFEEKFPIKGINRIPPNIDVVIHNLESSKFKRFAIESKFTEPYRRGAQKGLKSAYLKKEELWADIPEFQKFARAISPDNTNYKYLDSAQLIKHILGLKSFCDKSEFKLLYLWYDVPGKEGCNHRKEIEEFTQIAQADGIHFSSLTYQELIFSLASEYRLEHSGYLKYLNERYL